MLRSALQVALMAVSAVTASIGHVLEEQQFVKRPEDDKRLILEGPLADLEQSEGGCWHFVLAGTGKFAPFQLQTKSALVSVPEIS